MNKVLSFRHFPLLARGLALLVAKICLVCLVCLVFTVLTVRFGASITSAGQAAEPLEQENGPTPIPITTWLQMGPVSLPLPAFHDSEQKGYKIEELLDPGSLDPHLVFPRAGEELELAVGQKVPWRLVSGDDGSVTLATTSDKTAEAYLAVYVEVDRWLAADLSIATAHPVKAYLDSEEIALTKKETASKVETESGAVTESIDSADSTSAHELTGDLKLIIGKHLLLVHSIADPEQKGPWQVTSHLAVKDETPVEAIAMTTDPVRAVTIHDVLDAPRIRALDLTPDGKLIAVTLSEYGPSGRQDRWLEIRRIKDGGLEHTWRGELGISNLSWAPQGLRLSYITTADEKSTIWLYNLESGSTTPLVRDVEHLDSYRWAPNGEFLVYSFTIEAEPDERNIKRVENPADRQPWWRNRSYLMQVTVRSGAARRLTAGPLSTTNWSISPDSERLLFFRSESDLTQRPFSTTELWELNLATLNAELILDDRWINSAEYGPDPGVIALQGSPSAFDNLGSVLPDSVQSNDYGGQMYLYDLKSGQPRAVSRNFDPDIASIRWSLADGRIYALCTDTQFRNLYVYDTKQEKWTKLDTGFDVTSGFDLARDAKIATAFGTNVSTPSRISVINLNNGKQSLLYDPGQEYYRDITFGKVEPWPCELENGEILDGRVYYPRNYDPARKYPVIVYYYGGTSPVTRDYGGRYPKNIWAGQDYFVYVPEPSGATGYGQAFAARHVNDWGQLTAREVIAGTRAFLAAHPTANPEKVGCIGASYGGFLTMYILTQTDIFAAAVSHAGISSISSYWGEGFWGYAYGARALAHSFPWSQQNLYVQQSPLFHADRIHTPLLLVHGSSDTNVPVGESISLFTALKMLGREVEFVRIEGQDHWILDHDQRIVWNDTILAFFAKWLKDRPGWWEALYPETEAKKSGKEEDKGE